jgi:hypothetical protein
MTTLTKEKLIETIRELPDSFSIEDLFEKIILLQKIEIGVEQSRLGQVHSTLQAREKLKR